MSMYLSINFFNLHIQLRSASLTFQRPYYPSVVKYNN